jgi:hypothetical protein
MLLCGFSHMSHTDPVVNVCHFSNNDFLKPSVGGRKEVDRETGAACENTNDPSGRRCERIPGCGRICGDSLAGRGIVEGFAALALEFPRCFDVPERQDRLAFVPGIPYACASVVMRIAEAFRGCPAPSFSGLGRRPFTAVARVRIPLGSLAQHIIEQLHYEAL